MASNIKRRNFLKNSILTTSGLLLAPNFISCENDDTTTELIPSNLTSTNFNEGVASFDPTTSSIIIWSRYTTNKASVKIIWQLAEDSDFKKIVRQSEVETESSRDFTLAIEIKNLNAGKKFFYRFINVEDATVSPTGETLTFAEDISQVKLAVTSCANYAYGYFNVYEAIGKSEADAVVHLGDYIYEYGKNTYGSFREPSPAGEVVTLDEYRQRYRQYRSDEKLMKLHQMKPFICVWDDHEVTNDSYKDGAENHQESEGSYENRKNVALQAYGEYLPNNSNLENQAIIYRTIKIGNLADLIMLDTRIIGRDKQLDYANYFTATGDFNTLAFQQEWLNPSRTMLGETQRNWAVSEISSSTASWQIIGQQVLMGKMMMPAELLPLFTRIIQEASTLGSATTETNTAFQNAIEQLVTIKARLLQGDPTLTPIEIARVKTVLPYNLDAWDGYFVEREALLSSFTGKKVAVLAGDTHNAWQSNLTDKDGNKKGVELATSSVSSPGLEVYLGANATQMQGALQLLIDDLNYVNASQRGFMLLTVTQGDIKSDWNFINTVTSETYSTNIGHTLNV